MGPLTLKASNGVLPDWVIVGGESGSKARPMRPAWVRAVRDQCAELGVSFFFKQVGNNHTDWPGITSNGTDMTEWPLDLRIQEYPIQ